MMFEYKSDVAVLHGAFLSALEQQKNSENEKKIETVRVDLCGLSDDCLIKACAVLTEAITGTCVKDIRKKSDLVNDTYRRLHGAIFHSLLSSNGFTCSQSLYFEAVENIFPKIDWKFYYSLIASASLEIYFVEVASCLQDDLCILVLRKTLVYVRECESEDLLHCIQEVILKKHLFHSVNSQKNIDINADTIDQYSAILEDVCKTFCAMWKKYKKNDKADEKCMSLVLSALSMLRTMCDTFLEHLPISFSSVADMTDEDRKNTVLAVLEWYSVLIDEVYVVVTEVEERFVDRLCENDRTQIIKVVGESWDALELALYCASCCGLVQNQEELDRFKNICECLRKICSLHNHAEEVVDAFGAEIKVRLEKVNGLKKKFLEKGTSQNHNISKFWQEMYLRSEEETLCKLMACCMSSENTCRSDLIEVLFAHFDQLELSQQQNILRQRLEICQKSDALKLPNFINALTTCLNQAALECKDIFQEILKLSLQSPEDAMKRVIMQALTNSGQIEILVQMLRVLHPVCVFHPLSTSNTLLVEVIKDILSSDLTEKQLQNLLTTVKLLLSLDINEETLKIEEFIHGCILPHLNVETSTIMLEIILQLFQHICKVTRSMTWRENIAAVPVVFCLCQLIDLCVYKGDGNHKGQVLQTLAAFKEVTCCHLKLLGSKTMPWAVLSPIGRLHALEFFNAKKIHKLADLSLIWMLRSDAVEDVKEQIFSGVNPHHQYSLLATLFTQILPHSTVLEWESLCCFAQNVLKKEEVKACLMILEPENHQLNASEAFLVRCVTDALILISEHRQAPVSWTYVLYCYSLMLQRIVASNPDLTAVVLCEVCRLASALTEEVANHLLVSLLELSQGLHKDKLVCAAVNSIPHGNIRASLSEIATRS